ncbi:hypothetical protein F5Y10DRAFT_287486 [Nemania abortiva]|nr:hypothetical protein F5Y10DRAFT_287486 [Nemania abortiva]
MDQKFRELVQLTGYDPTDIIRQKDLLAQYFDNDERKRFVMEGPLGGGIAGLAWRIKYTPAPDTASTSATPAAAPMTQRIVLKTDRSYLFRDDTDDTGYTSDAENLFGDSPRRNPEAEGYDEEDDDDEDLEASTLPKEKKYLEILRWAKHLVHIITPPDDPLTKRDPTIPWHHMKDDHWIYMELLQNGTLDKFVTRALRKRVRVLPNRLLWRFFLCFLRMVIAMGWPPKPSAEGEPVTEEIQGDPHGGLVHFDMHDMNVMFGDLDNEEHTLAPILKLLDLGHMYRVSNEGRAMMNAVMDNLFDIGVLMVELVTVDNNRQDEIRPSSARAKSVVLNPDEEPTMTNATMLLPNEQGVFPFPALDIDLRRLICGCLATQPEDRPHPVDLVATAVQCIEERDEAYYTNIGIAGESDDRIKAIIQQIILDAN